MRRDDTSAAVDPLTATSARDDHTAATATSDPEPPVGRAGYTGGAKIGRYIVLDVLGAGAMGVVLAAYDPGLDRKVAIKLVAGLRRDGNRRLRMEREAQAMARLSHPNVVTVYEVGEHEDQVFVAMEFVKGQDLRAWLRAANRSRRAVLAMFVQAGRGLAAAHGVGLVHRDFKPENVFVGDDGRARVGDFGLARHDDAYDDDVAATREQARVSTEAIALQHGLTTTGAVLGTPAYMAPEQFTGDPTSARTDQFAFCVALWEALHGQRPFAGAGFAELRSNVCAGRRVPAPTNRDVPAWLQRVLDRGLARDPEARWPTTEAMLTALQADPTRRRRALIGVGVAAVAVAGWFGGRHQLAARQVAACVAEGDGIAEVWNAAAEQRLRAGLLASGVVYADSTAARVVPYFAAQADAWRQARTEVCLDANVRGASTADMHDRSTWCLDERRMELAALIDELSHASKDTMPAAVAAAAALASVAPCRDASRLARSPALPDDRTSVQAALRGLARVRALRAAGAYERGLAAADEVLADAERLAWPALVTAARLQRGALLGSAGNYRDSEDALAGAYFAAAEHGALEPAVEAATALTTIVGERLGRAGEGLRWAQHAEVTLTLLGAGEADLLRAEALHTRGIVQHAAGDYEQAKATLTRALVAAEQALGPDHPYIALVLERLAAAHSVLGARTEARALRERALAIAERALGPDHPSIVPLLTGLALTLDAEDRFAEATAVQRRALALAERTLGGEHPEVAAILHSLAHMRGWAGAFEEAKALHARGLAIREKALKPGHPEIGYSLIDLAGATATTGEREEARALYRRGLAVLEGALGPDHAEVAVALNNYAGFCAGIGENAEARAMHERALAIWTRTLGPGHVRVGLSLNNLGEVLQAAGAHAEARARFEQALAIHERVPEHVEAAFALRGLAEVALAEGRATEAVDLAERAVRQLESGAPGLVTAGNCRLVLARALWGAPAGQGRDRERAQALARQALDAFRKDGHAAQEVAEAEAFLAEHDPARPLDRDE